MGWFGMAANEKDDWSETLKAFREKLYEDDILVMVDCHI